MTKRKPYYATQHLDGTEDIITIYTPEGRPMFQVDFWDESYWEPDDPSKPLADQIKADAALIVDALNAYRGKPAKRLMNAAPKLLAACRMVVDCWERGDLAEAARACSAAIAEATAGRRP